MTRIQKTTPLHEAAEEGHYHVCKLIIKNVKDTSPKNSLGETPLDLAKYFSCSSVARLLREERKHSSKKRKLHH